MLQFPIMIIAGLILAPPVDMAVNAVIGGTPGKTISGQAGANGKCPLLYRAVTPTDYIYFSHAERAKMKNADAKNHCDRWHMLEEGFLERDHRDDWKGLNR